MQWQSSGVKMTGKEFSSWCEEVKNRGIAKSITSIAYLLGISVTSVNNLKRKGADRRTAYSCAAILEGLTPYGETK